MSDLGVFGPSVPPGMQIPVIMPEQKAAMEEADRRQARVIGLNTVVALCNGGHLKLDEHSDAAATTKGFITSCAIVADWVMTGERGDRR